MNFAGIFFNQLQSQPFGRRRLSGEKINPWASFSVEWIDFAAIFTQIVGDFYTASLEP
jgi:hypothetical protein